MIAPPTDPDAADLVDGLLDRNGGDLLAAFRELCATMPAGATQGETYEAALHRAVRRLALRGARGVPGRSRRRLEDVPD